MIMMMTTAPVAIRDPDHRGRRGLQVEKSKFVEHKKPEKNSGEEEEEEAAQYEKGMEGKIEDAREDLYAVDAQTS